MTRKRILIEFEFDGASDSQANAVCDAVAQAVCTEDEIMPTVLETLEANRIRTDVKWQVRRETWHPE